MAEHLARKIQDFFVALAGNCAAHQWRCVRLYWHSYILPASSERCWLQLQEERSAKGELKQLLAGAVQSERAAEKKLADASAELEAAESRLAKAEAALQVGTLSLDFQQTCVVLSQSTQSDADQAHRYICEKGVKLFGCYQYQRSFYIAALHESALSHPSQLICQRVLRFVFW